MGTAVRAHFESVNSPGVLAIPQGDWLFPRGVAILPIPCPFGKRKGRVVISEWDTGWAETYSPGVLAIPHGVLTIPHGGLAIPQGYRLFPRGIGYSPGGLAIPQGCCYFTHSVPILKA